MSISFKHSRRFSSKKSGFTLVELLVVSAIILLMTALIFFQQSKFNSTTLLRSLTYSIALSIRQAQVFGTSVRGATVAQTDCTVGTYTSGVCFATGYGVYVPSVGDSAVSTTYYVFADLNGDGAYQSVERIQTFNLGSGYYIKSACGVPSGQSTTCTSIAQFTTFFRRPNPDACLSTNGVNPNCSTYSRAYVTVGNTVNTDSRSVKVSNTGQISVCPANLAAIYNC